MARETETMSRPRRKELCVCYHDGKKWCPVREGWASLSIRERQIVMLIGEGKADKEIADELGMTRSTVYVYRSIAKRKLGVSNTAGLVRIAIENQIGRCLENERKNENKTTNALAVGVRSSNGSLLHEPATGHLQQPCKCRLHD